MKQEIPLTDEEIAAVDEEVIMSSSRGPGRELRRLSRGSESPLRTAS